MTIVIEKLDENLMKVNAPDNILKYLSNKYSFYAKGYRFMPRFKRGFWDGKISLFNRDTGITKLGFLPNIIKYLDLAQVEYNCLFTFSTESNIIEKSTTWKLLYPFRDCQLKALKEISSIQRATIESPTGSGKSYIMYCTIRGVGVKTLLLVPSAQLVEQLYEEFCNYSQDHWARENCSRIKEGYPICNKSHVIISTWQSIYKLPKSWFKDFRMIMVDECHECNKKTEKAKAFVRVVENCSNAPYRYGFTATVPYKDFLSRESIVGMFGPIVKTIDTQDLIDQNILADLKILQLEIMYDSEDRKRLVRSLYRDEVVWVNSNIKRRRLIKKICDKLEGNTLILFREVISQGIPLYEYMRENTDYEVYYIDGSTPTKKRLEICRRLEESKKCALVASLGTFSRGINISNVENLIIGYGLKDWATLKQSIGRVLRKGRTGKAKVIDFVDNLSWKKWENYLLKHGRERMMLYQKERFEYEFKKIELKNDTK